MHRLFVALRPPPAIRALLLDLMGGVPGARWQSDEQLHVTLRFIGAVERPVAEDIATALASLHAALLEVSLSGVGQFDTRGRAHTLWAGLTPHGALADLHRKVDQALVRCGVPPERRAYRPHITLARMKPGAALTDDFLRTHAALSSAPFALDHLILFESHLGRDAASYEAVERYPLRG
ncbi:RNA 2',3'-cyclic phosphodiesterase [Sphingomonas xinjiangensis]|uniref:RNA 2',3'-cyclic phosphodiesterase n=1 Tax=Sphingomonas xinjiangensis TaxID=643568 RepID=A0A840YKY8_9SPHN|nr:RNA 2',3'-cyclic phosphodiesterase [Sphingomonas xinjiangensis]MBB5711908.1 2'-5' RNA ligase [Sphingomonas xinjiangensis]